MMKNCGEDGGGNKCLGKTDMQERGVRDFTLGIHLSGMKSNKMIEGGLSI